ncbi:hypothetical protein SFRURICE_008924 [Spodoptera frugiperda]|nr:hypothetical protein SFRURICE_008924 [Spodoptera frugiperda]
MLCCCGWVWRSPIISVGKHRLALVKTDSVKLCFYMERCVLWIRTMDACYGRVLWMCAMGGFLLSIRRILAHLWGKSTLNKIQRNASDDYKLNCLPIRLPRWPSGCKCDCRARGLGFDSRVGRSISGLFSVFRKFLSGSTESGNVPEFTTEYKRDKELALAN